MNRKGAHRIAALTVLAAAPAATASAQDAVVSRVRAYYFGNSFTGNTMPGLHPLLGRSAGREWTAHASISPGVPIWVHMKRLMDGGRSREAFVKAAPRTDVIVMLLFGGDGLSSVVTEKWQGKVKFDKPTDIGDVAACSYLIREYLKLKANGRAYVYTAWPGIPAARDLRRRIQEEQIKAAMADGKSRREARKAIKRRKPTHEEMEPLRKTFDYPAAWLTKDYIPNVGEAMLKRLNAYSRLARAGGPRKSAATVTVEALVKAVGVEAKQVREDLKAIGLAGGDVEAAALSEAIQTFRRNARRTHCRKHMYMAMEGIKRNFPGLWEQGRLGMIPVGDVFLALDRKMRAGKVPGLVNIGEFSADGGHLRAGLPRYTLAATYYAVLFRDRPHNVDSRVFDDIGNYKSGKFGFYVHQPDLGVKIDITPQRARVVNDTIWEVVAGHPYTGVAARAGDGEKESR